MNLKIYKDTSKKKSRVEPMYLTLREYATEVRVVAVKENGDEFSAPFLVSFHSDGRVERMCSVNPSFGFQLDSEGRIIDMDFPEKKK